MSTVLAFTANTTYQFGLLTNQLEVVGGGSVESNAIRGWSSNRTDTRQLWYVIDNSDVDPDYPYLLQLKATGFYLDTYCDYDVGPDCSTGGVNRARLTSKNGPGEVADTGRWRVVATNRNDGTYHWFNKANGTDARLDRPGDAIIMNGTATGNSAAWLLVSVETGTTPPTPSSEPSPSSNADPSSSSRLSGAAIAGIATGVSLGVLLPVLVCILAWVLWRRRKSRGMTKLNVHDRQPQSYGHDQKAELDTQPDMYSDHDQNVCVQRSEMPGLTALTAAAQPTDSRKEDRRPIELPGA